MIRLSRLVLIALLVLGSQVLSDAQSKKKKPSPIIADYVTELTHKSGSREPIKKTGRYYRDEDGRTRLEIGDQVTIFDPAKKMTYTLDTARKTAKQAYAAGLGAIESRVKPQSSIDLGERRIEGLRCVGKRSTVTVPARPGVPSVMGTVETWLSPELGLPVLTILQYADVAITETYKNLKAGTKPDSKLFAVPADFKVTQ